MIILFDRLNINTNRINLTELIELNYVNFEYFLHFFSIFILIYVRFKESNFLLKLYVKNNSTYTCGCNLSFFLWHLEHLPTRWPWFILSITNCSQQTQQPMRKSFLNAFRSLFQIQTPRSLTYLARELWQYM